jgi:hypothetical protein
VLQIKDDDNIDYKRKEKFLIQSIKIPPTYHQTDPENYQLQIAELWTKAEQMSGSILESEIEQKKLKCILVHKTENRNSVNADTSVSTFKGGDTELRKPLSGNFFN